MNILLTQAINEEPITEKDIVGELHEICSSVHASCHEGCPVYELNDGIPWDTDNYNCKCFGNGEKMLKFIRNKMGQ